MRRWFPVGKCIIACENFNERFFFVPRGWRNFTIFLDIRDELKALYTTSKVKNDVPRAREACNYSALRVRARLMRNGYRDYPKLL